MKSRGAEYSTIFRKAGLAWSKGDVHKAMAIVEAGLAVARSRQDAEVVRMLQQELERYRQIAAGEATEW